MWLLFICPFFLELSLYFKKVSMALCMCVCVCDFRVFTMSRWSCQPIVYPIYFHMIFMISFFVSTAEGLWGFKIGNMLNLLECNFEYWSWIFFFFDLGYCSIQKLTDQLHVLRFYSALCMGNRTVNKDCSNASVAIWLLFTSFPFSCLIEQARNLLMEEGNVSMQTYWTSLPLFWKIFKDAL